MSNNPKSPKKYLSGYKFLLIQIEDLCEQKERIWDMAVKITSNVDSSGSGKGAVSDKVGNASSRLVDIEKKIDKKTEKLSKAKEEIESVIEQVSDDILKTLLVKRYINCKSFSVISDEMGYSYRQINRLHVKALKEVNSIIKRL